MSSLPPKPSPASSREIFPASKEGVVSHEPKITILCYCDFSFLELCGLVESAGPVTVALNLCGSPAL